MKKFNTLRLDLAEKTLTPAEKKKREEIAMAMERENPGMPMGKKMAIATAAAKRVAEENLDELKSSTLTNPYEKDKNFRTSTTSQLVNTNSIDEKIHTFMKIPMKNGEGLQGQKYLVGQEFKAHTDYFHVNEEYNKQHIGVRGQRTWTFMIYLNNVEEGGTTKFTKIDLEIKPVKGMAIIWNNVLSDYTGNLYSLHCGMPVIKGEKNIITKWFRQN